MEYDDVTVEETNIEQSKKPDVFISYSSKNADVANKVMEYLEQRGIQCWIAPRNITPGKEWVPAIQEALREAKVFVLIYTDESNASRQVMNEVALAFNAEKVTVPLCLTKQEMNDELKYYLTRVHWLNATSVPLEESLKELQRYVERGLGRTGDASLALPATNAGSMEHAAEGTAVEGKRAKKKGKLALWIGIAAAVLVLLCAGLGISAFFNYKGGVKKPGDLMEAGTQAFYYGNSGSEDALTARTYFEEAAKKGTADAYYYLGKLKEWDYDFKAAKEYYEEGVEADSDLCRLGLGYLYQKGNGVGADFEKAWNLYCEAAENDLAEADFFRGKYLEAGLSGKEVNIQEVIKYYQNVIKNSENEYFVACAHNQLGQIYRRDRSDFPKDYDAAIAEYEKVQDEKGMPELIIMKNYNLGLTYQSMKEEVKAEEYFTQFFYANQEMAKAGNVNCMYWCGVCYRYGRGTKKDPEAAKEWYLKADETVKEKNPKACCYEAIYELAFMYVRGETGGKKDYETALEYLKEAANAGYGKASKAIGDLYINGLVGADAEGKPDMELARQWYEKAIQYGETSAYCNIGYICENGTEKVAANSEEAMKWYQLGAAAGSASCMYNIGVAFKNKEDYETAFSWYQKAADLGDLNACYMVARFYEIGRGVGQSDENAFKWYQIAADEGDEDAIEIVTKAYYLGELSQEVNYEEALRYAKKGDELGSAICAYYCGLAYNTGNGAQKDQAAALQYFLKAAKAGDASSMKECGLLYLNGGRGVDVSEEEGTFWLEQAYKYGDLVALGDLADYFYEKEDYEKAFPYVLELCQYDMEVGDAYLILARMYLYERGTKYNENEALNWLAKAYEKGANLDSLESYLLGYDYFYGTHQKQNYDKAFLLFQASATESHESNACMMLGVCYYAGVGTQEDDKEALTWLGLAIDGGGLDETSEEWCRSAIANMVKHGTVSAEDAAKWLS